MAWCRRRWTDRCSAKARRAREISPAAYSLASRAVSAIDSLMGGDAGRAGLAAAGRDGRVTKGNQQVGVADVAVVHGVAGVVPGAGELDVAGMGIADGGGREISRRISRYWPLILVSVIAWSL